MVRALARSLPRDAPMNRLGGVTGVVMGAAIACAGRVGLAAESTSAVAVPAPSDAPVDVVVSEAPPQRRTVALSWNAAALIASRVSVEVDVLVANHHALVVAPYFATTATAPIYVYDQAGGSSELPEQRFTSYGGELGYRYYWGQNGPRGLFVGPSLVFAAVSASPQGRGALMFVDYGVAMDLGYEFLVADAVAIALGAGAEYKRTSVSVPDQQWPAKWYANDGFAPRILASIGWAL
jgi:hypothetical protein